MRVVSVHVGVPREVVWNGKLVKTGPFTPPVDGRVTMRVLNLDGERHADVRVPGGPGKAANAYPYEQGIYWQSESPGVELPWGMFGEYLATHTLLEREARIGDRVRV
jgi:MOSC domain-containing protein YiiM